MEEKTKNKSNITNRKYIVCGIIVFFIAAIILYIFIFAIPKDVKIPNVIGLEKNHAEEVIKKSKLNIGEVKEEYSSSAEIGHIIAQEPSGYKTVKQGNAINIIVSLGIEGATVPKVVGMDKQEAIEELTNAKLKYEIKEETSYIVEKGYVIRQEPSADEQVEAGTIVKFYVSKGENNSNNTSNNNTNSNSSSSSSSYSSSSSFTNNFGTPTTKCNHSGCTRYIASSGDTNCCTVHSNRCGTCGKYIDEDASYCMDCIRKALNK